MTAHRRLKNEAELKVTDISYKLDSAAVRTTQFEGCKSGAQTAADHALRWVGRRRAIVERAQVHLVGRLRLDVSDYLNASFASLGAPTTEDCGRLGGFAHWLLLPLLISRGLRMRLQKAIAVHLLLAINFRLVRPTNKAIYCFLSLVGLLLVTSLSNVTSFFTECYTF